MDSEHIKGVVNRVNVVTATNDRKFEKPETRNLVSSLLVHLVVHFDRSPTFAVAIFHHMQEQGFDFTVLKGDAIEHFMMKFGRTLNKLDKTQLGHLSKINQKLFRKAA